ncbi:MAG: hypothetical protein H0T79_04720 [Deltaproteobacteria bacterium]|nr:hypothetical protein [Deltaproteobacteria bacterium]
MRSLVLVVLASSLFACGKDPVTSGGLDASGGTSDAPPLTGEKFSLVWGPVSIPSGDEGTQCVDIKLSNPTEIKVRQLHNVLGGGSHHLIVYRNDMDTVERKTPYDCQPFTGALNATGMVAPMMITQKHDDALTLPEGVAYTLKPNQMIRIEMHYNNTGDVPVDLQATTEFYAHDPALIQHEANILFIGSPDIKIPAMGTQTVNQFFSPGRTNLDLSGAKFFAITGHTHQYGLDVEVNTAATKGGAKTSVYAPDPFDWSEPETTTHQPEFQIPAGGGFDFKCDYRNTSGQEVGFGESTNDEMCFFWAYYYPSKGAFVCVHSDDFGGADVCCPNPDPNDQICPYIASMF